MMAHDVCNKLTPSLSNAVPNPDVLTPFHLVALLDASDQAAWFPTRGLSPLYDLERLASCEAAAILGLASDQAIRRPEAQLYSNS